jgi:hypothetical protein
MASILGFEMRGKEANRAAPGERILSKGFSRYDLARSREA